MPDIADQLDAAIGAAPIEAPALDPIVELGRDALRRRRLAYGVGVAATALVIGGTAWAVAPSDSGPGRSEAPRFDGQPSESAAPEPTEPVVDDPGTDLGLEAPLGVPRDDLVRFIPRFISSARGLEPVDDTVVILDQRFNPAIGPSFAPSRNTGAVEIRKDGLVWYVVARRPADYIAVAASQIWKLARVRNLGDFLEFAKERYAEGGGGLL